ncbi:MAG: NUDIX hydrolase [Chloroflexi bacterium]|nr:NUDIX hydrolase [Chloroflexota bacterium]
MAEPTVKSERLYQGRVVGLRVDTVRLSNGTLASREIVEHPGAVCVVPLDQGKNVLLVRQYRKAAERSLLEVPAGTLEPGEDPVACAHRELEEETGCRAGEMRELVSFYTSPGFCTEVIHAFVARDLTRGRPLEAEDEELEVVSVPLAEAVSLVRRGEIRDAKSIAALLLALDAVPRPGRRRL